MNDQLIARIQAFTLTARATLEQETEEQLQGLYGWLPDGSFGRGTALDLPEAAETRRLLEAYVAEEEEAGFDAAKAREKLKRETAFTWLNRFVAFRMMEERAIIKATIGKLHKSNAFIYWLVDEKDGESPPTTPVDALGEGPVDAAYREFLLWQCEQLAAEVSVLFDPTTLASRLCPRPGVLKELSEAMNADNLAEAWQAGNEETIGWVYEGFIEDENAEVFEKFGQGKKVLPEEIGAATQRFTPRWIVRYLIENSVGRIWVETHPDSRLAQSLEYLGPLNSATERPLKLVKEISFLDPCCGSMHFGLVAFDLFAEMYREERENAGKPGWPQTPSAASEEEIPELILASNLHGIDIDLRAVQVSALALLIKARTLNLSATATDANLACANVEQLTAGRLDAFIEQTEFSHPIYERILRRLSTRLKDSDHLGTLLRIESEIEQLIAAERQQSTNLLEELPGVDAEQFETQEGIEEFFTILADQIGRHLDHFVQASRSEGDNASFFAREASKGLRFLRLVERRYDVVATNPPYMSRRNMSGVMAKYLDEAFKSSKGDLYAACIMRCAELADPLGLIAMVTQQSFMFISSYEDMRADLRKTTAVENMTHLGPRAFPNITGEKVNTTAFVLRREPEAAKREEQVGTYFRLVKERDADAKRLAFESSLDALHLGEEHDQFFRYKQSDFDAIPGKPWVYWVTTTLRNVFQRFGSLEVVGKWTRGLSTADNPRFVRFWWEAGISHIGFDCASQEECANRSEKWFPLSKGGSFQRWYGNQSFCINYGNNGRELKAWLDPLYNNSGWSRMIKSPEYYFHDAITYSSVTTSSFSARYTPAGSVFDQASNSIFSRTSEVDVLGLLAVVNSSFSAWVLSLNPTINIVKDDIYRIPCPAKLPDSLVTRAGEAVSRAKKLAASNELTLEFACPYENPSSRSAIEADLTSLEVEIDAEVSQLYGLSEDDLAAIDRELNGTSSSGVEENDNDESAGALSPAEWAQDWVSYALGTVLGRFELGKPNGLGCGDFSEATVTEVRKLIDPDGIMPSEEGHDQDIAARVVTCLDLMLGTAEAYKRIGVATGVECKSEEKAVKALRGWLDRFTGTGENSFWKYHHQLYRKRPVYWPFQSPNKSYTIWVFHEKIGPNTLHTLRDFVTERLNLLEREIADLRPAAATNRAKEKQLGKLLEMGDDLREFSNRLKAHIDAGYESCIDDGVVLNAAPLHDLLPSWKETGKSPNDPAKAWKALEAGKFDWAHQAMRYWPDRVTEACRNNRSFAIAHNLET